MSNMNYVRISTIADATKIVREKGKIVDGRNSYLEKQVLSIAQEMYRENGTIPGWYQVARAAWEKFKENCDLYDKVTKKQKYFFPHAEKKAIRLVERAEKGLVKGFKPSSTNAS